MRTDNVDYDEDADDDPDAPLVSDLDHADDDDVDDGMVCPACGKGVAIDTPKCPHCGDWIRPQPVSLGGWPYGIWMKVIVILLLGPVLLYLISGLMAILSW